MGEKDNSARTSNNIGFLRYELTTPMVAISNIITPGIIIESD
jgi:hypothetical protein